MTEDPLRAQDGFVPVRPVEVSEALLARWRAAAADAKVWDGREAEAGADR